MKRGKQFQIQSKGRTLEIAGGLDVTVEIDQDKCWVPVQGGSKGGS